MVLVSAHKTKKISQIDEFDRKILNMLSDNGREKLLNIARDIRLSVPSTKARIDRLVADGVITKFTIQVDTEKTGMPIGVHARIKLKNITEEKQDEFINHLKKNKNVIDIFSIIGDVDLLLVVIARDSADMNRILFKIRHDFTDLIADWETNYIMKIYKLEDYSY
ncbi:MAG: winged helix-turn-helix transcriptional regulator [Nanohaloarchaea archaeon]|nr:winged helix-turn-helix transcriptional regulator [Candidatus Nanohaloarchaea archaeon]